MRPPEAEAVIVSQSVAVTMTIKATIAFKILMTGYEKATLKLATFKTSDVGE